MHLTNAIANAQFSSLPLPTLPTPPKMVAEFTVAEFSGCPVFRCPFYRCPVYRLPCTLHDISLVLGQLAVIWSVDSQENHSNCCQILRLKCTKFDFG